MKELKKMSYATGLRPHSPWLLFRDTMKTNLFFQSVFPPEEAARDNGDHVLQIHPFLSPTKPSLDLVMKYKTLHRWQKNISQSSLLPRDFLKFWKLQTRVFKQSRAYLFLWLFGLFSHFGDELQPEQSEETWCAAALAWALQPAVAHAAEHLEALDPSCLPSMQRRGTKEITAITRLFPWVIRLTFLQDVHKLLLAWETGAKTPSGKCMYGSHMNSSNKPP